MDLLKVQIGKKLQGICEVPGDKSISHRSAIIGAIAEGETLARNYQKGADCLNSIACLKALGVEIEEIDTGFRIFGKGLTGFQEPDNVLNAGNSGTTMRLLLGVLAAQDFFCVISGDDSLNKRPMDRVVKPLQLMGASIWGRKGGSLAPLAVQGKKQLQPLEYQLPVASAQVKSALLLAGLSAKGTTRVIQPAYSRDHTEKMLSYLGVKVNVDGNTVSINEPSVPKGREILIPGDLSSAAFLLVAACILPESDLLIRNVGINPTRTGALEVLCSMGAEITTLNVRKWGYEPVADLRVRSSSLRGITIKGKMIPRLIDEIPALAVAASYADGTTMIRDAKELRYKETDRLHALAIELQKFGVHIQELPDGLIIEGKNPLKGAEVFSRGDHRMAMALVIAGMFAEGETTVIDTKCIDVSFPNFVELLQNLGQNIK